MKKFFSLLVYSILISITFSTCFPIATTNTSTAKKPSTGTIYNPFIYKLHPEYFVFNTKEGQGRLYTKINLIELMFAPIGPNKTYQGKIKMEYFIYKPGEYSNVVDSASIIYNIKKLKGQKNAITYINIKDTDIEEYYLHIKTTDMLRRNKVEDFIYVNKTESSTVQNFYVKLKDSNEPYFRNYFRNTHELLIENNKHQDSIYIKYFNTPPPLPYPPFSSMEREALNTFPDSIWSQDGRKQFRFNNSKEGLYFLQTDTTHKQGLSLINAGNNYPYVKTSENMLAPLEYLTSTAEFKELKESSNKKLAIDRFWIGCGGNVNRARELIRIYYNRTHYANIYFTSYTEGWRTDRGMIYLMFGPPKAVKKSPEKETWIYSDKLNYRVLQFVFNKTENPFTNNDFVLERNLDFKSFWFKSIESWRKGKVYTVFN